MNIVYITIGRGIGADSALSFDDWADFKAQATYLIEFEVKEMLRASDVVIEVHEGIGIYDGVREESAIISARWEDTGEPLQINYFRGHLRRLAEVYGQKSVALSVGTSELVFA